MTAEHSSYEQGFRDALLAAIASLWGGDTKQMSIDYLSSLLGDKQHDLWTTLALVRVPSGLAVDQLRARLRAPNALAIDGEGRMLFVRLNGTEYDTGVTALLDEVKRLKKDVDDAFFNHLP